MDETPAVATAEMSAASQGTERRWTAGRVTSVVTRAEGAEMAYVPAGTVVCFQLISSLASGTGVAACVPVRPNWTDGCDPPQESLGQKMTGCSEERRPLNGWSQACTCGLVWEETGEWAGTGEWGRRGRSLLTIASGSEMSDCGSCGAEMPA